MNAILHDVRTVRDTSRVGVSNEVRMITALKTHFQSPLILYLDRNLRTARQTAASLTLPVSFRVSPRVASDRSSGIGGCRWRLSASHRFCWISPA